MELFSVVLLFLGLSVSSAEVVTDFNQTCPTFFADPNGIRTPPTVLKEPKYKQICQTLNGTAEYATLYDTDNRIPVYSAYRFEGYKNCTRKSSWFIEPQLDDPGHKNINMASEGSVKEPLRGLHQALNEDYSKSGLDKGHLAPVYQAMSQSCSDATFTLTNAAPQNPSFNRGQWKVAEQDVADILSKSCANNSAYIVAGVVPGNNKMKNRVNIPSHFWTAFCCLDNNKKPLDSGGFLGENKNGEKLPRLTVKELELKLKMLYRYDDFSLFGKTFCQVNGNLHSEKRKQPGETNATLQC